MQGILYLILSVLLSVITVTFFKLFQRYQVATFQAIVVNYVVCIVVGNLLSQQPILFTQFWQQPWFVYALFLGFLFISVFYAIGLTAQRISASASMIAAKLSVVIPVTVAIFIYHESATLVKVLGILLSLLAVYLTRKKNEAKTVHTTSQQWLLPIYVFVGSGIIDTMLKWMQQQFIPPAETDDILSTIFLIAFLIAISMVLVKKEAFAVKSIYWGIGLGVPNYFCMFFLVKSLSFFQASILFPVNNIAIVVCTALVSIFAFHEKMSKQNWFGLVLAIVSIICIAFAR